MSLNVSDYGHGNGNDGYIKNMEVLAHHSLSGYRSFQLAMYKTKDNHYYIYGAGRARPICPIIDVTDPENPIIVGSINANENQPKQKVGKIQAADGLLITALSCSPGAAGTGGYYNPADYIGKSGIQIYDIATDPEHPKLLSYWFNGLEYSNVHRFFYNGGPYVYLSSSCAGFDNMILRIVDISDPTNPKEAGRWWLPEQFVDGYPNTHYDHTEPANPENMKKGFLHGPPFVRDGIAYLGYGGAGLCILDVKDVTRPRLLSRLPLCPPFGSYNGGAKTHTALPLPGRDFVVVFNEGERFTWFTKEKLGGIPQAVNNLHMVDVSDPTNPTLVSSFPYPQVPEGFPFPNFNDMGIGCQGPFGPHNIHEPMSNKPWLEQDPNRVYCCYFHAGMRVFDVSDPYYVKEIAYFMPPNPTERTFKTDVGPLLNLAEDCIVDDRGNIFMNTYDDGLWVLRTTI